MRKRKGHNKLFRYIFKEGLLCLFLGCLFASESDFLSESHFDSSPENVLPLAKRIKTQSDAGTTFDCAEDSVGEQLFKKIIDAGEAGCTDQEIRCFLSEGRSGPQAVLEAVVRIMFRKSVVITHNDDESIFWYKGPMTAKSNAPDIRVALARYIVNNPFRKHASLASIGDALLQQGCYVQNYYTFLRLYHAVLCLCRMGSTEPDIKVQSFLSFAQQEQKKRQQSFDQLMQKYAKSYEHLNASEGLVAKAAFDFPIKIRDDIEKIRKDAEQSLRKHHQVQPSKAAAWVHEPLSYRSQNHLALIVAEVMRDRNTVDFAKVFGDRKFLRRSVAPETLRKTYNAVCVICYEEQSVLKNQVRHFFDYVQKKQWPDQTTILEEKLAYCQANPGPFDDRLWETVGCIRALPQPVLKKLQCITIPLRRNYRFPQKGCQVYKILKEMRRCALEGATLSQESLAELAPTRWKGCLGVLRNILNIAFQNNMTVFCHEQNAFRFSFSCAEKEEFCVPMEVLIAARFMRRLCHAKDKVCFAYTLHQIGYPMATYEDFSDTFDAVSVVCRLTVAGLPYVEKARGFFEYIKSNKKNESLQALTQGYSARKDITDRTVLIAMRALSLEQNGLFESWGLMEKHANGDLALERFTYFWQKDDSIIIRILQEYAQKGKICPYKIFSVFLPHCCHAKSVADVVFGAALRNKIRVIYDKVFGGFSLKEGPLMSTPSCSIKEFILEKLRQDTTLDDVDLAYEVYNAGYPPLSSQEIANLRKTYTQFPSDNTPHRPQQIFGYDMGNCDFSQSKDCCDFGFSAEENVDESTLVSKESCQETDQKESAEVSECDAMQTDCSQVHEDFKSFVQDGMHNQMTFGYEEITSYAKGAKTPEAVLEFVMDCVFKHGYCVQYDKDKETYKFLTQTYDKGQHKREEVLVRYMQQTYTDQDCTVRDRAECAYEAHVRGASYSSFEDFSQDFGAVCMVKDIGVKGMEEIARCKRSWNDMKEVDNHDMSQRALSMALLM